MLSPPRKLSLALAAALTMALMTVAPPAQAALPCDSYPPTFGPVAAVVGDNYAGPVTVTASITGNCSIYSYPYTYFYPVYDAYIDLSNATEGTSQNYRLRSNGASTWITDSFDLPRPVYGKWVVAKVTAHQSNASTTFTKSGDLAVFYKRANTSIYGTSGTYEIKEGASVSLTGHLYSTYSKPEKVHLETAPIGGDTWTRVATADVDTSSEFELVYTPTSSVRFRYVYDQTDWATAAVGTGGVINFVAAPKPPPPPPPPPNTAPTAPTNFNANAAGTSAEINWSPPTSDGGAAITGYRVSRNGRDAAGNGGFTDILPASAREYTFRNLRGGDNYRLTVAAINSVGEGAEAAGNVTIAAPPPPPVKPPPPVLVKPPLGVKVKSKSKQSKFYIDVNPNKKGRGYYFFTIQKFDGADWVSVGAYHTKGKKETRTINLKRGTYRAVVSAGGTKYRTTTSGSVYLRK